MAASRCDDRPNQRPAWKRRCHGRVHLRLFARAAYFRRGLHQTRPWQTSTSPRRSRRRHIPTSPTLRPLVAPAHADHHRGGVRRHRNEPALHDPGMFFRHPFGAADARERARRAVARHLRARDRHLDQVHRHRDARGQRRRRRHPRADGARAHARRRERQERVDRSRHFRRRAAVWRRHDHAGHHRARRRRGTEGRDAVVRLVRGAAHRRDSHRDLRDPAARHASGRPTVWSRDGAVVHRDRGPRADLDRQEAHRPLRDQPGPRPRLLRDARAARLRGAGRGVSGGHRRRGPVRRHGSLRKAADSSGVVQPGAARPLAQLLRSGRAAADRQHRGETAVLPSGAVLGAPSHGGAGDGGRHHRLPGAHLGRLLADPPGRPAWLQPADGHRSHLLAPHGADLRAAGELGADGRARSPSSSGSGRRARSRPPTASP